MGTIIAASLLAFQLSASVPRLQYSAQNTSKRGLFSRLGHAIRRVGSIEPALSMRFSSWGIPEARNASPQAVPPAP